VTGRPAGTAPTNLETVVINNRIRGEIGAALAALRLGSPNRAERLAAAKELQGSDNEDALPIIQRAVQKETDSEIQAGLETGRSFACAETSRPAAAHCGRSRPRRDR
jgi:urea transport system permease protein